MSNGYSPTFVRVARDGSVSANAKAMYLALYSEAAEDPHAPASTREQLTGYLGVDADAVDRAAVELVTYGVLRATPAVGGCVGDSPVYELLELQG